MIRNIWKLAQLDLLRWWRMPLAMASVLLPPIMMTFFLVILSFTVTQQPVALVLGSNGTAAQRMSHIIQADDDAYLLTLTDSKTAEKMLSDQKIAAIITIPADFDAEVMKNGGDVMLTLNNIDIDFADDIRRSVDRSVGQFNISSSDAGKNPYLIQVDEHDIRKTNVDWLDYQIIPALVLLILNVGLMGTALMCAQDIERKTSRLLLIAPQSASTLIAGRLSGGLLASLAVLIPAVALCSLFGIINPPLYHWWAIILIFIATSTCASSLGAVLGSLFKETRTIAMAATVFATYMYFLGGGFTTISFLSPWLQTLSSFIPIRYAIDGLRQALFYSSLQGILKDIIILFLTAFISVVIGSYAIKWSWADY